MRIKRRKVFLYSIGLLSVGLIVGQLLLSRIPNQPFSKVEIDGKKDKPGAYMDYFNLIKTPIGQAFSGYETNYAIKEFEKAKKRRNRKALAGEAFVWTHRGPGNVGGRTKQVIIDPDDPTNATWYAASAGGGVWKTANSGGSWQSLTDDLPNLATNVIVMAPSNHNILYIGTGEGYGGTSMIAGNGIYKSVNSGESWTHVSSTADDWDFRWINKILIDDNDPDELLVATNSGLFKTIDGGDNWTKVYSSGYRVQDLAVNEGNPQTIYAAVNSLGIIKSYNKGNSWMDMYDGLSSGGRYAVAVSKLDTNKVFVSVEKDETECDLFISGNGGSSWKKLSDGNSSFINFLGEQGWFNQVLKAHPFNANKVFLAGVYMGLIEFTEDTEQGENQIQRADTVGTSPFLGFVNFGGDYLGGGLSSGAKEDGIVQPGDFTSIEIRFGPGMSQKAYRFTVPAGASSGVPPEDYRYRDYIDVPFEVWDTDNNRQLMVSFRDQERDGKFNLIKRSPSNDVSGREYIFVQAIDYSVTADPSLAKDGAHVKKNIYFLWPTLEDGGVWNPNGLPQSHIKIKFGAYPLQVANTKLITSPNQSNQIHVDHHDLKFSITNIARQEFMILNANDGGLGVSYDEGQNWTQHTDGYHTAQLYGVAKRHYKDEYIGGLQDNGTYKSPVGQTAGSTSKYTSELGGDGFELLWHSQNTNWILASIYDNDFRVSTDGGQIWRYAAQGLTAGDGPFVSRLSNSFENPDLVFAAGNEGVYRHPNFGEGRGVWKKVLLNEGWKDGEDNPSTHVVRVSLADPGIVWAGQGMFSSPYLALFISKDYGESFTPVPGYDGAEMGYLSGIATHPADAGTAYALFSIDHRPKILRTTDYGQKWEDISGFGKNGTSSNGFPDVAVNCLMVHNFDRNVLWAGTEIGIFESPDNGKTWYYADNGLPAVSIWQMYIQESTIVVATHGRGIWTASQWPGAIKDAELDSEFQLDVYPNPSTGIFNLSAASDARGEFDLIVYSIRGKKVKQLKGFKEQEELHYALDLSDLPVGNYIVGLQIGEKRYTAKVVRQ